LAKNKATTMRRLKNLLDEDPGGGPRYIPL
jgi:hypothetical protein